MRWRRGGGRVGGGERGGGGALVLSVRGDVRLGAPVKFAPRHDESLMKLRRRGTVMYSLRGCGDRDGPRRARRPCVSTVAQLAGQAPRGGEAPVGRFKCAACGAPSVQVFAFMMKLNM